MAGKTVERGYGSAHKRERERWDRRVKAGLEHCRRCGRWIAPDAKWHLDHDDVDKSVYLGPSHARCNEAAGGRRRARLAGQRVRRVARAGWW